MCRNIRVLHHFEPPTTEAEIYAAALQYVRKVGGLSKVTPAQEVAVQVATVAIVDATRSLLAALPQPRVARNRELEQARGRARFERRKSPAA
jgi:hypothetical protein